MPEQSFHNINRAVVVGGSVDGSITNVTNSQPGQPLEANFDMAQFANELSQLLAAMQAEAKEINHYEALTQMAKAEQAAKANDFSKAIEYLKSAGNWALEIATKIGVPIAIEAIKQAIGLK